MQLFFSFGSVLFPSIYYLVGKNYRVAFTYLL